MTQTDRGTTTQTSMVSARRDDQWLVELNEDGSVQMGGTGVEIISGLTVAPNEDVVVVGPTPRKELPKRVYTEVERHEELDLLVVAKNPWMTDKRVSDPDDEAGRGLVRRTAGP